VPRHVDIDDDVGAALDRIVYGPYVSAAVLTNETGRQRWDGVYAIATRKRSFNVVFNMSNVVRARETARQPGSSLMVFSPARLGRRLIELSDQELMATYTRDLDQLFPGFSSHIVESHVQRWPLGLAYCFPGRGRLQPELTRPMDRLFLAGDYLGTWYTETAIQTGFQAAQDIRSALHRARDGGVTAPSVCSSPSPDAIRTAGFAIPRSDRRPRPDSRRLLLGPDLPDGSPRRQRRRRRPRRLDHEAL